MASPMLRRRWRFWGKTIALLIFFIVYWKQTRIQNRAGQICKKINHDFFGHIKWFWYSTRLYYILLSLKRHTIDFTGMSHDNRQWFLFLKVQCVTFWIIMLPKLIKLLLTMGYTKTFFQLVNTERIWTVNVSHRVLFTLWWSSWFKDI